MPNFTRLSHVGAAVITTLSAGIGVPDTTISITLDTGWPTTGSNPFYVTIDKGTPVEEKVLVTALNGTTLTVTRAQDNTTAQAHSSGAIIQVCFTAYEADEANQHYADTTLDNHTQYYNAARLAAVIINATEIQGVAVSATAPTTNEVLEYNGTEWVPAASTTIQTKTAAYTALAGDFVVCTSGTFTVTSPASAASSNAFSVTNQGSGVITVTAASGVIFGPGLGSAGSASLTLGAPGAMVRLQPDGTNWTIVDGEQDSGWLSPALLNSWTAGASPYIPRYRIRGAMLSVTGSVSGGNGVIFNFPAPWNNATHQGQIGMGEAGSTVGLLTLGAGPTPVTATTACYMDFVVMAE